MGRDHKLKKLARMLLTTTCLTAAANVGKAGTFAETVDLSNSLSSPTSLGTIYDTITGNVGGTISVDPADYFSIPGLTVGGSYHVTLSDGLPSAGPVLNLYDGLTQILQIPAAGGAADLTVPLDLRFGLQNAEGASSWTVTFTANAAGAPEPGTMGAAAAALAALALRRRRKK